MTSPPTAPDRDEALFTAVAALASAAEARRFLADLCTPKEIEAMAERWQIARALAAGGKSYRDIHAATGASLTTITRVARFLNQEPHHGYRLMLDRVNQG